MPLRPWVGLVAEGIREARAPGLKQLTDLRPQVRVRGGVVTFCPTRLSAFALQVSQHRSVKRSASKLLTWKDTVLHFISDQLSLVDRLYLPIGGGGRL